MEIDRTDIDYLKELLHSSGMYTKKDLGQHFLIDRSALECIMKAAEVTQSDTVVEIGPGPGVLTEQLLQRAARVLAFELDSHMIQLLKNNFPRLEIIQGNVLETAPEVVKNLACYKIVANIPYQITTPLLRTFLEGPLQPKPSTMTLLVQKEVAERLAALERQPGRGYLSVLVQEYAKVHYVQTVPSSSFWPEPKVDSAIIHMKLKNSTINPQFLRFVRNYFVHPRKQLKNVIAGVKGVDTVQVIQWLEELGFPLTIRAQELSNREWNALYMKLQ